MGLVTSVSPEMFSYKGRVQTMFDRPVQQEHSKTKCSVHADVTHSSFTLDLLKSHGCSFVNTFICHSMSLTT